MDFKEDYNESSEQSKLIANRTRNVRKNLHLSKKFSVPSSNVDPYADFKTPVRLVKTVARYGFHDFPDAFHFLNVSFLNKSTVILRKLKTLNIETHGLQR